MRIQELKRRGIAQSPFSLLPNPSTCEPATSQACHYSCGLHLQPSSFCHDRPHPQTLIQTIPPSLKWLLVRYSVTVLSTVTIIHTGQVEWQWVMKRYHLGRIPVGVPEEWQVFWVSKEDKLSFLESFPTKLQLGIWRKPHFANKKIIPLSRS